MWRTATVHKMVSRPLHDHDYALVVELLHEMRRRSGLTQVALAKRLGVDQSLVSKVERKERRLDVAELRRVCTALGVSLGEFVERFESAIKVGRKSRTTPPRRGKI